MAFRSADRASASGDSGDETAERRFTNDVLEAMMDEVFDEAGGQSAPGEGDPQEHWFVDGTTGEMVVEEEDDDDPDFDDVDEDELDEDDEYYPFDVDDEEEDEEAELDEDDVDEDGEEDDEDDEEGAMTIDLSAFLQAAASGAMDGNDEQATRMAGMLNGIGLAGLRRLLSSGQVQFRREVDEDDDDDEYGSVSQRARTSRMSEFWDPITEPIAAGQELLLGGDFKRPPSRPKDAPASAFAPSRNIASRIADQRIAQRRIDKLDFADYVPNTNGTVVARYPARCYCGQFSEDSSFFYTCTQDFQVHMYDMTRGLHSKAQNTYSTNAGYYSRHHSPHVSSLRSIKTIQGRHGSWTITDANLSPDNQWMIYSSITPYVHLVSTRADANLEPGMRENQVMLDFSNDGGDDAGIWSIRFSGDSREIVAGAHFGNIYVYDIEARRRVLKVEGHSDDVNGVAFADSASSNVLISGSDDSYVKVWDRRSLSGGKPAGVLPGHTEGVTFVAPKGDGRYCISNGKDQSLKLWDLRKLVSSSDFDRMPSNDYGLRQWDYRNMYYKKPRYLSHPQDCSVMTYRGHAVLRTLIRCHFSPAVTTGQRYLYSGSADGRIHIWSLDGRVVQVLDRSKVIPLCDPNTMLTSDPSAPVPVADSTEYADVTNSDAPRRPARAAAGLRRSMWGSSSSDVCTVRDVSWHSSEPVLMSTAWDGPDGQSGSIAKHEWKGFGKNGLSLEDAVEKAIADAAR